MTVEVRVPQLPESVSDATLVAWHKQPGDTIRRDENLADLETDKVVLEVPAPVSGVIVDLRAETGATVTSGQLLAVIAEGDVATGAPPATVAPEAAVAEGDAAAKLSPAARRLIEENRLDPGTIAGSGRDGRITKGDVVQHLTAKPEPAAAPAPVPAPKPAAAPRPTPARATGRAEQRVPMTRLRARIAQRLVEAQSTQALLTTFNEVDMHALSELRGRYKDAFEKKHGVRLGFMSFFVKACIEALRRFPVVNASVEGSDIVYHEYFDVGVAVSTDRGLVVPILRDADGMSFADIEKAVTGYAQRAREGTITLEELTGGTFSITNGGVFGSLLSTPIVNAPQSAILGMHKVQQRPVVVDGLSVACIDEWKNHDGSHAFGGTCLNAGCIPSKALLESTELVHRAQHEFKVHGIQVGSVGVDLAAMQKRKAAIVRQSTQGIVALFKGAGVTPLQGHGRLLPGLRVEFTAHDGALRTLQAGHVVLASGSQPMELRSARFDGQRIVDSWGALEFDAVPKRLGVIGAGVIGLELGSVWRRLGAEVVILEALPDFLPMADSQVAREALRHFRKLGLDIRLGAKVTGAVVAGDEVQVSYTDAKGSQSLTVDRLVVAIGRRPYTGGLLADGTGVTQDERGFIEVDDHCRTSAAKVWAVGDCVRGPMLAHKGKEEGVAVADAIAGRFAEVNYKVIPSVIYTAPEVAWVGLTEQQATANGRACKTGSFPFSASGRARAMEAAAGFCKIVAAVDDDEILGVHIIGPMAGELIAEAVLAMEYSASSEDLQRTIHAHPTLSEALHEAALAADKRAIDCLNK